jgi:transposase-like protein
VETIGVRTRAYSAEFKQATVEELLSGQKRPSQICREREIDVTTLRRWRIEYEERGAVAWTKASTPTAEQKVAELERVIGQLTVENLVLKKALERARSLSRPATPSSTS